ncbi:claspin-like isoform X1 [Ruditapes philippinarum]|uniref:claspin-like isoform X1 n=1 Tax=Ruditapes philippinarum TaxID=129788 RepID=UPI00295B1D61|nr:claspin-like isoform X1 [Ruditapes philippinarum]
MSEQKLDEVDGECPVSSEDCRKRLNLLKHPDLEKSLTDSGMDDGSNSGSLDTGISGENSDDDDDVVLRKPKKTMHRILDDDSDMSQDVTDLSRDVTDKQVKVANVESASSQEENLQVNPRFDLSKEVIDLREKRKQEFTPEQALDVILQDSSDDSDEDDNDDTPSKKKRIKRPVVDSSSDEDDNVTLMDTIKKHSSKTGTDDLFDSEETKQKHGDDSDSDDEKSSPRKIPDNLFTEDKHSDSDSSGCRSSGSEVEKSDHENGDEGFDESSIDPKLLAKLKKGAGKKPKKKTKRDELQSIHSESQRIVREARVNLPYHQPAPKSLNDFLARANRKQHEYKVLKGFRDTTKANLMQDILQNVRIQTKSKTQEELDKYSDSDEDWNPDEEEDKKLKDRIDERMRNKSGVGMPLGEIKLDNAGNENSNQSSVIVAEVDEMDVDDEDELPDICDTTVKSDKESNRSNTATTSVPCNSTVSIPDNINEDSEQGYELLVETVKVDSSNTEAESSVQTKPECVQTNPECVQDNSQATCSKDIDKDSVPSESVASVLNNDTPDDLLFDWEKNDCENSGKIQAVDNECTESRGSDLFKLDDNKENIDPNGRPIEAAKSSEVLTPSHKDNKKSSPRSSAKKKKNKIAALAGIDLDNVRPCLSGNDETFITLEEGEEAPKHPGVQKLMDRLTKHSVKTEKKHHKDTDISIISKDVVGIDKEELKFNTFTYHGEDEEANPLMKYEAPGAKLVALKEQLKEKMKARREIARQKRQEVYDLDNEEGGYDAEEEAEMSEHSDTDVEDEDDFEEQFGDDEELIEEKEKEKNPFADDEADEDGEDDDEEEGDVADEFEEEEEYSLKLDVTDDEQSGDEDDNEDKSKSGDEEPKEKPADFKEPEEPDVLEKPFSLFGRKSRGNSISDTQFPSGQTKTSTLTMPIEDSQDLYNSLLPEITQRDKPKRKSQDFSFMLEDSQSNMLDADGYIKTKSTGKKKMITDLESDDIPASQNDMSELLGLCSGRFMDSQKGGDDKTSRKSLFDDNSVSNTQGNMEELMGLCSGVFADKSGTQSGKKGTKRPASDVESDDDSITAFSDNEDKQFDKDEGSDIEGEDNEEEGDTDHLDSEEEEAEKPTKFTGFTVKNKHGKIRQEFVDEEAELSGSEYDSDENLDLAEEDDIMEMEEGDKDAAKIDQNELRDEVGRIHLKQLIDEDKRELLRYQEMYLPDGDLYSEGGGRVRRFKWSNMEDDSQQDMFDDGSDGEEHPEETEDYTWRKERYEREQFLKEQQEKEAQEGENSQFLKLGKVFLKKKGSVDTSSSDKGSKSTESSGAETPGFPGSFYKLPQQKRGSFLARSKEALAKIAEMTKPVVNPSAGAKSSGKFTFNVISPDKEKEAQLQGNGKQRKAHVPKAAVKETRPKQPPAKKPKLDSQSSFTENSIFNLF